MSKHEYIDSQKILPTDVNSVVRMCRWLTVSTSGFYHWLARPQSATSARRQTLIGRIQHFFEEAEGLVACQPRPFRIMTEADAEAAVNMPDLVKRDFTADRPGCKFVGNITYIHTWQEFIYLATVIDCYSKKVVGWSITDHMRTELVADALKNAAATTLIEPDAIWHSDRAWIRPTGRLISPAPIPASTTLPTGATAKIPAFTAGAAPDASMNSSTSRPAPAMSRRLPASKFTPSGSRKA